LDRREADMLTTMCYVSHTGIILNSNRGTISYLPATHLLTYYLTPQRRILLEKLITTLLRVSYFIWVRKLITMSQLPPYLSLSWSRCIQSTASHRMSLRSILISSHLRLVLPNGHRETTIPKVNIRKYDTLYHTVWPNPHRDLQFKVPTTTTTI